MLSGLISGGQRQVGRQAPPLLCRAWRLVT